MEHKTLITKQKTTKRAWDGWIVCPWLWLQPRDKEEDKKSPELSQWQRAMHRISLLILPRCRLKLNVNVSYCWSSSYRTKKSFKLPPSITTLEATQRESEKFFLLVHSVKSHYCHFTIAMLQFSMNTIIGKTWMKNFFVWCLWLIVVYLNCTLEAHNCHIILIDMSINHVWISMCDVFSHHCGNLKKD